MSERWTKESIWGTKKKISRKRARDFSEEWILEVKRRKDILEKGKKKKKQRQMQGLMKKITQELQGMGTGDSKRGRNFWRNGVPDGRLVELLKSHKESDTTERLN